VGSFLSLSLARGSLGSSLRCLRGILATEGLYGLYRAYWIHQTTWAPFNGLYCLRAIRMDSGRPESWFD
jgi:hypothetical protein